MKRCCKDVDITDADFICRCIYECFSGKWKRRETRDLLTKYCKMSAAEADAVICAHEYGWFHGGLYALAQEISKSIKSRDINLPQVRKFERVDSNSGKRRRITQESLIHQIYDYIAVNGMTELLRRKVGENQFACIKGRGGEFGRRRIEKWVRRDTKGTRYCVKADIQKCYPSVPHGKLKAMLKRDIKNPTLVWLLEYLIDQFDEGLGIGSYLATHLCNYYLSHLLRFIFERSTKQRGKRVIKHAALQMDDLVMFGANKRKLRQAFDEVRRYTKDVLGLDIKGNWRLFKVSDKEFADILGYKIGRTRTTVRKRTFRRISRAINRIERCLRMRKSIYIRAARRVMSYFGRLKHCDCERYRVRHWRTFTAARRVISDYDKARRMRLCCN